MDVASPRLGARRRGGPFPRSALVCTTVWTGVSGWTHTAFMDGGFMVHVPGPGQLLVGPPSPAIDPRPPTRGPGLPRIRGESQKILRLASRLSGPQRPSAVERRAPPLQLPQPSCERFAAGTPAMRPLPDWKQASPSCWPHSPTHME